MGVTTRGKTLVPFYLECFEAFHNCAILFPTTLTVLSYFRGVGRSSSRAIFQRFPYVFLHLCFLHSRCVIKQRRLSFLNVQNHVCAEGTTIPTLTEQNKSQLFYFYFCFKFQVSVSGQDFVKIQFRCQFFVWIRVRNISLS